jgi:hypothetical protein
VGPDAPVRVTPWLLAAAGTRCPRRLHHELDGSPRSDPSPAAWRARGVLEATIAAAHVEGRVPVPADLATVAGSDVLVAEERAVLGHALAWYRAGFVDHPVRLALAPSDVPTLLPRRRVELRGRLGLLVTGDAGWRELRQVRLGGPPRASDPREDPEVRLALLRLARARALPGTVVVADLLTGLIQRAEVDAGTCEEAAAWLDDRLARARERADPERTEPGADCVGCGFYSGCPAHPGGANATRRSGDLRPGVLVLSPSDWEDWLACRRRFRNRRLLRVPESDTSAATALGLAAHEVLRSLHTAGACGEAGPAEGLAAGWPGVDPAALAGVVAAHRARCPSARAVALGHEVTLARMHRQRGHPPFLATARVDALWLHPGVLEVRDYKTGRVPEAVRDDPAARLAAWVAAPAARARGAALRVTYEALGAGGGDPEPFEVDDDDLEAITAELSRLAAAIRAEETFAGIADPDCCRWCGYRSVCPDRPPAVPADGPSWPAPPAGGATGTDDAGAGAAGRYAAPPP